MVTFPRLPSRERFRTLEQNYETEYNWQLNNTRMRKTEICTIWYNETLIIHGNRWSHLLKEDSYNQNERDCAFLWGWYYCPLMEIYMIKYGNLWWWMQTRIYMTIRRQEFKKIFKKHIMHVVLYYVDGIEKMDPLLKMRLRRWIFCSISILNHQYSFCWRLCLDLRHDRRLIVDYAFNFHLGKIIYELFAIFVILFQF